MREYKKHLDYDVEELLQLRREGWTFQKLAARYDRNHTTVRFQCRKHNVKPMVSFPFRTASSYAFIKRVRQRRPDTRKPILADKYIDLMDEAIGPSKSYREYKKEALQRPIEKKYEATYGKWR